MSSSPIRYPYRSTLMNLVLPEQTAHLLVHERQQRAAADGRAQRLLAVRRWQRRKDAADQRLRLARLALG